MTQRPLIMTRGDLSDAITSDFPAADRDDLVRLGADHDGLIGYLAATHELTRAEVAEVLDLRLCEFRLTRPRQAA